MKWANNFDEIEFTLSERDDLQRVITKLIDEDDIPGKVLEGGARITIFKEILKDLANCKITMSQAIYLTENKIPRSSSRYNTDGRVFATNWAERLLRIQLSRFYNQAAMMMLLDMGETQCYVPPTATQKPDTNCAKYLAGRIHSIKDLLDKLINSYSKGNFSKEPKIPDHLYCSHVIKPIK